MGAGGTGGHTAFSAQILWCLCQTGVYKAKPSREFSYFLAYSPGVHLNRNQLFAFSLIQHVAGEKLASGLAIIKNKNILLCWENSTTGNKRTEIICIQDSRDGFQLNICSPSSTTAFILKFPDVSIIWSPFSETERTFSSHREAGTLELFKLWSGPTVC